MSISSQVCGKAVQSADETALASHTGVCSSANKGSGWAVVTYFPNALSLPQGSITEECRIFMLTLVSLRSTPKKESSGLPQPPCRSLALGEPDDQTEGHWLTIASATHLSRLRQAPSKMHCTVFSFIVNKGYGCSLEKCLTLKSFGATWAFSALCYLRSALQASGLKQSSVNQGYTATLWPRSKEVVSSTPTQGLSVKVLHDLLVPVR